MALKKYFDGVKMTEVELPDTQRQLGVLDIPGLRSAGKDDVMAFLNPTGVDPDTLQVDAAALPNLVPTDGATGSQLIPPPPPGSGEGAGLGQPSGSVLRDPWANNPARGTEPVDTLQSGPVGSALTGEAARGAEMTAKRLAEAAKSDKPSVDEFEQLRNSWKNKGEVVDWIKANGSDADLPANESATRAELEDAAQALHRKNSLSNLA